MEKLKYLLLYKERINDKNHNHLESVYENMNVLPKEDKESILSYMRSGLKVIEFISPTFDPITGNQNIDNVIFTDGKYVWDGVLINWVENYSVRLPRDFLNWVEMSNIEISKLERNNLLPLIKTSEIVNDPN